MDIDQHNVLYEKSQLLVLIAVAVIGIFAGLFFILYSFLKNPYFLTEASIFLIIGIIAGFYIEVKTREHEKKR